MPPPPRAAPAPPQWVIVHYHKSGMAASHAIMSDLSQLLSEVRVEHRYWPNSMCTVTLDDGSDEAACAWCHKSKVDVTTLTTEAWARLRPRQQRHFDVPECHIHPSERPYMWAASWKDSEAWAPLHLPEPCPPADALPPARAQLVVRSNVDLTGCPLGRLLYPGTRLLHMVREVSELSVSAMLYHSEDPAPERWIHRCVVRVVAPEGRGPARPRADRLWCAARS